MMIDFSRQKINTRLDFMTKNLHRSRQPLIICSLGRLSLRSPFSYTLKAVNFLLFHHDEVMVNVMETCSTQISGYRPDCLTCKCPSSCQLLPILCTSQYLPLLFLSSNYAHGFKVFCFYIFCIWKMLLKYAKSLQGISGEQLSSLSWCTEMLKGFRLLKMNSKMDCFIQKISIFFLWCVCHGQKLLVKQKERGVPELEIRGLVFLFNSNLNFQSVRHFAISVWLQTSSQF